MKWYLETPRIKLREMNFEDENNVVELDSDPEVMRYISDRKPSSRSEVRGALERTQLLYEKHQGRFGFWAAIEKSSNLFMGWFHFRPAKSDPENVKRIELGYRLKREFWGKGYATEGSEALIKKGFNELQVEQVFAITMKENIASQKVMEKAGLKFSHEFRDPELPMGDDLAVVYVLDKEHFFEH
jgi:RimJ/RimL family protein N-acetyltransferase